MITYRWIRTPKIDTATCTFLNFDMQYGVVWHMIGGGAKKMRHGLFLNLTCSIRKIRDIDM